VDVEDDDVTVAVHVDFDGSVLGHLELFRPGLRNHFFIPGALSTSPESRRHGIIR
jgi:hypothetical protein